MCRYQRIIDFNPCLPIDQGCRLFAVLGNGPRAPTGQMQSSDLQGSSKQGHRLLYSYRGLALAALQLYQQFTESIYSYVSAELGPPSFCHSKSIKLSLLKI